MTVFDEEVAEARRIGRCMGCNKLLARRHGRKQRVMCTAKDCKRYYHSLYGSQPHVLAKKKVYMREYNQKLKLRAL